MRELLLGDRALVAENGQFGDLLGGARLIPCRVLNVVPKRLILTLRLGKGSLVHRPAAGDQVHQRAQPRDDDDDQDPERLAPSGQLVVPENVGQASHAMRLPSGETTAP